MIFGARPTPLATRYESVLRRRLIQQTVSLSDPPPPPQMGVGYSPNLGPGPGGVIGLDGKDKSLLRVAQTSAYRDREQWPKRVAGLTKVPELCLRRPSSTADNVAAVAEKKQRRRGGRLRARESVMMQMYNNHHADLDSSLGSLRCSFQQCSFVSRILRMSDQR